MKNRYTRTILTLFLAGTFSISLNAQTTQRCASYEGLQRKLQQDPSLQQVIDQQNAACDVFAANHPNGYHNRAVVVIPVIFHVIYKTAAQNISTTRLAEQINVLNKDYRALNTDIGSVPSAWTSVVADCEVEFCLAHQDPSGNWTDGIERVATTVTTFSDVSENAKHASQGGADAWDNTRYLNIWVCNLGGGLLGYSSFPGVGPANEDGVVLNFNYVGVTGALSPYNKGRTATHEIGHFLWLLHTWGDDGGACTGSDYCSDTPNQASEHYGCPSFPATDACTSSSPGTMSMNYMDYTDDACMYMFTQGQKTRMWTILTSTRSALVASNACTPTGVAEAILQGAFGVTPSPSTGKFTIHFGNKELKDLDIVVYNVIGEAIYRRHIDAIEDAEYDLDLTGNNPGVYFLELSNAKDKAVRKIMIQ